MALSSSELARIRRGLNIPEGGFNIPTGYERSGGRSLGVDALFASAPGGAADYYGFSSNPRDRNYIFGDRFLGKLREDWNNGIKTGGNEQIYKILTGLGSGYGENQAFVKKFPSIGNVFKQYFETGKYPANWGGTSAAKRAIQAYDYALRETGRDAVRDREPGMFGGLLKGNIGSILGTAAGFAIPGVGPAIGGAVGGAIQGGVSNGALGALTGGLRGYGIGSGANWLAGKAGLVPTGPAPIVERSLGSLNTGANSIGQLTGGGSGGFGVSGSFASGAGRALGSIGNTGTGGNGVGVFNDILGRTGDFLSNNWSDIAGLGLNYIGSSRAADTYEDYLNQAIQQSEFTPYNVRGGLGGATFNGTTATSRPSTDLARRIRNQGRLTNRAFGELNRFNRNRFSQDYYQDMFNLEYPEMRSELDSLISRNYNQGNMGSSVGDRRMYTAELALENRDIMRRRDALAMGWAENTRLYENYLNHVNLNNNLRALPDSYIAMGADLGKAGVQSGTTAANLLSNAGGTLGDREAAFWSGIGDNLSRLSFGGNNSSSSGATYGGWDQSAALRGLGYDLYNPSF